MRRSVLAGLVASFCSLNVASAGELSPFVDLDALPKSNDTKGPCRDGLASFSTTVFPLIRQKCASCHGDTGRYYRFAASNVELAYSRTLPMQDFARIMDSYFVQRGGGMVADVSLEDLVRVVTAWWDGGQNRCDPGAAFRSLNLPIPSSLPNPRQGFTTMAWSLRHLGEDYRNVSLEMEIQKFSEPNAEHPGAYLLVRPRVVTTDVPIHIADLQLAINGRPLTSATGFRSLDMKVAPLPMPSVAGTVSAHPVLSGRGIVILEEQPGMDELSVGFNTFEKTEVSSCQDVNLFARQVRPWLGEEGRACYDCHGGNPGHTPGSVPKASQRLNMDVDDMALCNAFRARLNFRAPADSPLVNFPDYASGGHPQVSLSAGELRREWMPWILGETAVP